MIGRVLFLLAVTASAGKILVRDKRIPRPVRWMLMLTVVCLWIPGPIDEVAILLTFGLVVVFWREPLREAWAQARTNRERRRDGGPLVASNAESTSDNQLTAQSAQGLRTAPVAFPKGER